MEIEVYLALSRGGVDPPEACLAAQEIRRGVQTLIDGSQRELATKSDIARMEQATKSDIARLEQATKSDIARLEQATKMDIARLDVEIGKVRVEMAGMRSDLTRTMAEGQRWTIGSIFGGVGLLIAVVTLLKFVD
ncbi:hypothetical protein [Roseateles sp.]|uniref:hypothetical protein n=1 Tax=Roseateles sp. TaxID=1971397 RepID=UPI0031E3C50F